MSDHRDPSRSSSSSADEGEPGDARELVGRLLGSAGPDLTCEACFEALDRFVEAELAGADADLAVPGMATHLEGCPACREDRDSLRALVEADAESPD